MELKPGFYKETEEGWYYAPNAVYNGDYSLLKEQKDTYPFPVDGWRWYDDEPEGFVDIFNKPEEEEEDNVSEEETSL
jgi:hypothetical protein